MTTLQCVALYTVFTFDCHGEGMLNFSQWILCLAHVLPTVFQLSSWHNHQFSMILKSHFTRKFVAHFNPFNLWSWTDRKWEQMVSLKIVTYCLYMAKIKGPGRARAYPSSHRARKIARPWTGHLSVTGKTQTTIHTYNQPN